MASFDDLVKKLLEQATAPNPASYGRVTTPEKTLKSFPKRDMEDEENDKEEEGELMTHMKQQGLIPKGSKPFTVYSGTREKR